MVDRIVSVGDDLLLPAAINVPVDRITAAAPVESLLAATTAPAARAAIGAGTSNLVVGTTAGTAAAGDDARLHDQRTPVAHSAALITSGNLDVARNTASIPHDVWQPSGGTWPARPTVPSGARVNAIGYPGLTDVPSWLVSGTDSYTMRTA